MNPDPPASGNVIPTPSSAGTRSLTHPTDTSVPRDPIPNPSPEAAASPGAHTRSPVFNQALGLLRRTPPPGIGEAPPPPATIPSPEDVLPARMLNEFVYCPRLFYYEHVEGVFVENADTLRGAALHRHVDSGKGDLPSPRPTNTQRPSPEPTPGTTSVPSDSQPPTTEPETIHSRSVSLGSPSLGVVAKLDLVECLAQTAPGEQPDLFTALEVCPVDYKAGAPKEGPDANELWPTDRMQLGLQMLLLRDNGYLCREGVIYYRATKQRVRLPLTDDLEAWVRQQIAAARETARGPIPPPLDGSPKCVRCSLAPVCLPDETRLLARLRDVPRTPCEPRGLTSTTPPQRERAEPGPSSNESAPRRLLAARDDTRALYLNTPGLHVGRRDETLLVKEKDRLLDEVRLTDLHHVALFGNIQITTQAVHALCDAGIPITWFSGGGWFYGLTRGHDLKNVFTRIEQFRLVSDTAFSLRLSRLLVQGKIRNQRTLLMRNHVEAPAPALARLRRAADDAVEVVSSEQLLGVEGAAAATYFENLPGMLKAAAPDETSPSPARPLTFDFAGRNRRPPTDPVNALLSLAYSLLAKDCTLACYAVGFDPYVGFYHQPRFGRPALALDLMEEFRPLVAESVVLTAVNNRIVSPDDFVRAGEAVNLTPAGRKKFFQAYEQRLGSALTHPVFDYKVSYRRAIELQARILARVLTGEIPEYIPLTTR